MNALNKLEARGLEAHIFMLDAGSLRGLKLRIRRIEDDNGLGFDVLFWLTDSNIEKC